MDKRTRQKIESLKDLGFEVRRKVETTKHSFEVPKDTLQEFFDIVHGKRIKIKDAIAEAFEDWVAKNRTKPK